jgi:excinuclease ABC subunit C
MSVHDPALRLLQRVRDEAHRFANRFNADLRSKKIKESILDDFAGLGEVKRASLMQKFGNLEKIRKAGVENFVRSKGLDPNWRIVSITFCIRRRNHEQLGLELLVYYFTL